MTKCSFKAMEYAHLDEVSMNLKFEICSSNIFVKIHHHHHHLSVPERSEGTEVSKIAVRHSRISVLAWRHKDFGVAGEAAQGFWRR